MGLNANSYFTSRTPISVGPNKNPGADLEAFVEQATISLENGEVETSFLVNVVSPRVNVLSDPINAPTDGTDASTAFATAVAVAKLFTPASAVIYCPRGTYTLDSQVVLDAAGLVIEGDGRQNTVLQIKGSSAATSILHFGVTDSSNSQTLSCGMRHLTIDGNGEGSTAVVQTWNVQDFIMDDVEIKNGAAIGLLMETHKGSVTTRSRRNRLVNSRVHTNAGDGVKVIGDRYLHIDDVDVESNGGIGLHIAGFTESSGTPLYAGAAYIHIGSCVSSLNTGSGFYFDRVGRLTGDALKAEGNGEWGMEWFSSSLTATTGETSLSYISSFHSDRNASGGVNIDDDCDGIDISFGRIHVDDTASSPSIDLNSEGVVLRGVVDFHADSIVVRNQRGRAVRILQRSPSVGSTRESTGVVVNKMVLVDNGDASATNNDGLYVEDSTDGVTIGYLKSANSQTSGSNYEVRCDATVQRVQILSGYIEAASSGNEFSVPTAALDQVQVGDAVQVGSTWAPPSVASVAGVLDLPVWGRLIHVSGTTGAITGISPSWPGRVATLRFTAGSGWPTLNASATVEMGSNFTAASDDDTVTLVCDGTLWCEVSRSAN